MSTSVVAMRDEYIWKFCLIYIQVFTNIKLQSLRNIVSAVAKALRSTPMTLRWRHNALDVVSNHQPRDCLLSRLFRRRPNKTSKLRVTGLCEGNSPVNGEFPAQRASYPENVSIWWRHHGDNDPTLLLNFHIPMLKRLRSNPYQNGKLQANIDLPIAWFGP